MDDLISRQWLMECVNEGWIKFDTEKDTNTYIHLVRDIAPPAQPGWIPCSTALPEHDGEYLVTIKAFTPDQVVHTDIDIARFTDGKWHKAYPVTAWMSLPTPYREGGQDGKN